MYKQGKNKILKIFSDKPALLKLINIFYEKNADKELIGTNGCKIISLMYFKKEGGSLNEHRYEQFVKCTARATFQLQSIPPTEGAAKQHVFRTYLQLQKWLGNDYDATHWGWKVVNEMLLPNYSDEPLIPDDILKKISCRCESGCKTKVCSCKKHGLKCTNVCANCDETQCSNFEIVQANNLNDYSSDFLQSVLETEDDMLNEEEENCDIQDANVEDENVMSDFEDPLNIGEEREEKRRRIDVEL